MRIHPFGSHLIVYREDGSEGILVIHVRHQRENWQEEM
ncbi:type II toxin-antitoxin system RelE/ParE family toxin [Rhizobium sp. CC-YZS058]|nr:type II toxin-antitoxin system RelE/ParE family toxin [Rhizobium sp. CC-YZS058]MEA3535040.1 type II toxin-antitoxin system RelE/ParE family toxin [Rhizobium sp. CC-YZS058]